MSSGQKEPTADQRVSMSRGLWIGILAVFVAFVLVRVLDRYLGGSQSGGDHPAVGKRLAMLDLNSLSDGPGLQIDDLAGKTVLLNFWGTWCPPCLAELPHMAEMAQQFSNEPDFHLIAVSTGPPGQEESLNELKRSTSAFLQDRGLELPVYADVGVTTRLAVNSVLGGNFAYPTTLLLDKDSVIRGVWVGYRPGYETSMKQSIQRLLGTP